MHAPLTDPSPPPPQAPATRPGPHPDSSRRIQDFLDPYVRDGYMAALGPYCTQLVMYLYNRMGRSWTWKRRRDLLLDDLGFCQSTYYKASVALRAAGIIDVSTDGRNCIFQMFPSCQWSRKTSIKPAAFAEPAFSKMAHQKRHHRESSPPLSLYIKASPLKQQQQGAPAAGGPAASLDTPNPHAAAAKCLTNVGMVQARADHWASLYPLPVLDETIKRLKAAMELAAKRGNRIYKPGALLDKILQDEGRQILEQRTHNSPADQARQQAQTADQTHDQAALSHAQQADRIWKGLSPTQKDAVRQQAADRMNDPFSRQRMLTWDKPQPAGSMWEILIGTVASCQLRVVGS